MYKSVPLIDVNAARSAQLSEIFLIVKEKLKYSLLQKQLLTYIRINIVRVGGAHARKFVNGLS